MPALDIALDEQATRAATPFPFLGEGPVENANRIARSTSARDQESGKNVFVRVSELSSVIGPATRAR